MSFGVLQISATSTLLVVLLAPVIHAVLEYEQYKLMPDYAQGSVDQTHNDIMFLSLCSMYCLAGEDCISFSYNANSRTCSLSSDPVLYTTGVPPEDGLLHFVAPNKVMRVPPGHMFNPYSRSCLKVYTEPKIQPDAKAYCEFIGEQLATFRTLESMQWLRNKHTTTPGLLHLWTGLEKVDDTWTWNGNLSDPLTEDSVWCDMYYEGVSCADIVPCGPTISMNDAHCQAHYLGFICEKPGCYTL